MLRPAHIEMKHRMFRPFLLIVGNGETFEEFFSSFEIGLQCRDKKRLSEPAGTTQKDIAH